MTGEFVLVAWYARDHDIAEGHTVFEPPAVLFHHLVLSLLDPFPSGELLNSRNVHAVDTSTIIGQQRRQRPSHDFTPVDDADRVPKKPVSVRQDDVVNVQVLQDLDHSQRRAWQDTLLRTRAIQISDVLVHVENVAMAETLDIFGDVDDLLEVLILTIVENGIVNYNAIDIRIRICGDESLFDILPIDCTECIAKPADRRPSENEKGKAQTGIQNSFVHNGSVAHFSLQVFAVQSAYMCAAGSSFARTPRR